METTERKTDTRKTDTHKTDTQSWPDLAIGLYDKLTGRGAEITYEFEDFDLHVPSRTGSEKHAHWKMNGVIKVRTHDDASR